MLDLEALKRALPQDDVENLTSPRFVGTPPSTPRTKANVEAARMRLFAVEDVLKQLITTNLGILYREKVCTSPIGVIIPHVSTVPMVSEVFAPNSNLRARACSRTASTGSIFDMPALQKWTPPPKGGAPSRPVTPRSSTHVDLEPQLDEPVQRIMFWFKVDPFVTEGFWECVASQLSTRIARFGRVVIKVRVVHVHDIEANTSMINVRATLRIGYKGGVGGGTGFDVSCVE